MRFQPLPDLDQETYLPSIFRSKHRPNRQLLLNAKENVFARCRSYSEKLALMQAPLKQDWQPDTKAALQSCYEVVTAPLNKLKDDILEALKAHSEVNLQRCAYCMLSEPKTWDHYLPKSFYPEYAAYHANLVYVCFGCNHRKHDDYHDADLVYCHPYYTVVDRVPILHCVVSVVEDRLTIDYYCAGEGGHEAAGHIAQEHLARLGLNTRFKSEASSLVSGFIGELRVSFPRGVSAESLMNLLRAKYGEAQLHLGVNAWDARLWHGLNQCRDFLGYVNRRIVTDAAPSADGFDVPAPPQHQALVV